MSTLQLILSIIQVIVCLVLIVVVLFQSSKSEGLGSALGGAAETFFGKNGSRSIDAKLAKITKIAAVAFVVLTFVLVIV